MGIRVICEKRYDMGQDDRSYPAVFCDICSRRIEDATEASYYWDHPMVPGDAYYEHRCETFFLHNLCAAEISNQTVKLPDGRTFVENKCLCMPLEVFPFYLGRNLKVRMNVPRKDDPTVVFGVLRL